MAAYPNKVSFSLFHHFNGWSLHLSGFSGQAYYMVGTGYYIQW